MLEKTVCVLEKIKENKNLKQIMLELDLNYKELFFHLKKLVDYGYKFNKKYYENGNIFYNIKYDIEEPEIDCLSIYPTNNGENFRSLFISDLHIGSSTDRLDLVSDVYKYAINNNIRYIINTGDFIESNYTNRPLRLKTIEEQINCIINEYPCNRKITNLVVYGNHDLNALTEEGLNIGKIIENKRPDIVNLGFGKAFVGLRNDYILLKHETSIHNIPELNDVPKIKFLGHSHKYKLYLKGKPEIYVPALCDTIPSNYNYKPFKGFLDVNFYFSDLGLITKADIKNYIFYNGLHLADEANILVRKK